MPKEGIQKSLYQVLVELRATLKSLYGLAPFAVVVLTILAAGIVSVAVLSAKLMVSVVLLVVLAVAVMVYISTNEYGEAALALVAGLLTVYSVNWTPWTFVGFISVWLAFSFFALMISSIRLAAKSESIYRQAALALAPSADVSGPVESQLKEIGADKTLRSLGPIERAEVIRLFAFRRLPMGMISPALKAVEILSVITQIEHQVVAKFIADVYRVFDFATPADHVGVLDTLFVTLRESAVPPVDFFTGFDASRHLILSRAINPTKFFGLLREALESGVAPAETAHYLAKSLEEEA